MQRNAAILILLAMGVALGGCANFSETELARVKMRGVSRPTYEKLKAEKKLTLAEVTELSGKDVPDEYILRHLTVTEPIYPLKRSDVVRLRDNEVSEKIIDYLLYRADQRTAAYSNSGYDRSYDYYAPYSYYGVHPYPRLQIRAGRYW